MKTATTSKPNFSIRPAARAAQARAAASPVSSAFNGRGVVETPAFTSARPAVEKGGISFTVLAHRTARGWIAEATWQGLCGHLPADGRYPHAGSKPFATRSEAVDDALCRGLRQVQDQLGPLVRAPAWSDAVQRLQTWMVEAVVQVRANDETLPLRGRTVIDLCSGGLGGFGVGLAGLGARVALACEIDPAARAVYLRNVRPATMHDDLCTLDGTRLQCDILTVGLLCQAFSKAGKGRGFADPVLANVYTHTKRLLREIDAKAVVIECARQFLTQDGGRDADEVRQLLMQAGYRVQHRTLDAAGFGLPQSRERSFIVATRLGLPVDQVLGYVFPAEHAPAAVVADIFERGVPATIASSEIVMHAEGTTRRAAKLAEVGLIGGRDCQGYRIYDPQKGLGATMTASGGGRAQCTGAYLVDGGARGLTPREACRMQGLPDWAAHHPVIGHALRHAGNAVAVPVARELGRQLAGLLGAQR